MRVLVADDEPMSRRLLAALVTKLQHEVIVAEDGLQALEALSQPNPPPMAILDWNMPGADGTEVCRRVRAAGATRYTYIALLTARNKPEDVVGGFDAGADDFIVKPVSMDELRARLRVAERILKLEGELFRSRAYLEAVLANIDSGVVLLDPNRRVAFVNAALEKLLQVKRNWMGAERDSLLEQLAGGPEEQQALARALKLPDDAGASASATAEVEVLRPARRILRWLGKKVPLPIGHGWLEVIRDVTGEADLARALQRLADRDQLTGLLNRRGGADALMREAARAGRERGSLGVSIIDIDHFKDVNDRFGHATGDRVLQEVARAIAAPLRSYDLVMRWGGEEFLVVTPGTTLAVTATVLERVRKNVEDLRIEGLPAVTVSAGVDEISPADVSVEAAIARADKKLYHAKAVGRNNVCAESYPTDRPGP